MRNAPCGIFQHIFVHIFYVTLEKVYEDLVWTGDDEVET